MDDFQFNLEEKVSLPLLVRDWVLKKYPKKCCISLREFFDKEINFTTSQETSTLSQLVITPNSRLNSAPGCAYRIEVEMDNVCVGYEDTEEWSDGMDRTVWLQNRPMDWRAPDFFEKLEKAIGCQCRKNKKKRRSSRTS